VYVCMCVCVYVCMCVCVYVCMCVYVYVWAAAAGPPATCPRPAAARTDPVTADPRRLDVMLFSLVSRVGFVGRTSASTHGQHCVLQSIAAWTCCLSPWQGPALDRPHAAASRGADALCPCAPLFCDRLELRRGCPRTSPGDRPLALPRAAVCLPQFAPAPPLRPTATGLRRHLALLELCGLHCADFQTSIKVV
jgi:hypothetical protein